MDKFLKPLRLQGSESPHVAKMLHTLIHMMAVGSPEYRQAMLLEDIEPDLTAKAVVRVLSLLISAQG